MKIDVMKLYGHDFFELNTVPNELVDDKYKEFYKYIVAIIEFINTFIESKEIIKTYYNEYKSLLTINITDEDIDHIINRYDEMKDMNINVIGYIFSSLVLMNQISKYKDDYIQELATCKKTVSRITLLNEIHNYGYVVDDIQEIFLMIVNQYREQDIDDIYEAIDFFFSDESGFSEVQIYYDLIQVFLEMPSLLINVLILVVRMNNMFVYNYEELSDELWKLEFDDELYC